MAKRTASSSDKTMNLVLVLIIIAVLAAGIFTVSRKISDDAFDRAVEAGTAPQTVATLARQEGLSVDEFLESYGLTDGSVTGDTSTEDFYNSMTLERYAAYNGTTFDDIVSQYGLEGKVEETTKWGDAQNLIPLGTYIGIDAESEDAAEQFAQFKESYGLGDDVTLDTPWGDVEETVMAAQEAMINAMTAAQSEDGAEAADESAETADENAESTEGETSEGAQTGNAAQ